MNIAWDSSRERERFLTRTCNAIVQLNRMNSDYVVDPDSGVAVPVSDGKRLMHAGALTRDMQYFKAMFPKPLQEEVDVLVAAAMNEFPKP